MTTQIDVRDSAGGRKPSSGVPAFEWHGPEFQLPACVRLNGEQVVVLPTAEGVGKFVLRVENEHGELRTLTRDEELALAVTPGTPAERDAAIFRVGLPEGGLQLVLLPRPWREGDLASVLWQLQHRGANDETKR